jgi:imidazolonepropionase-like amidohydrolase
VGDFPTSLSERCIALQPVATGAKPAFIHAPEAIDVEAALLIADEFHLHPVLLHCTDAARIAGALRAHGSAVVLGALKFSDKDRVLENPGKLAKAGVKVAFCTDAPLADPASLRMTAHLAVKYGMSPESAIRALTLSGAEILGMAARTGSIDRGKDADLLLLSGDPLDLTSRVQAVISGGKIVYEAGIR